MMSLSLLVVWSPVFPFLFLCILCMKTLENTSCHRKEMSEDHLVSDACLMYSRYTGQGKIIPRSEWFASFKDSVREAEPVDGESFICPTAPAEVRVRFDHACQELAMMGYVKPSKKKRKGQEEGPGPKGAVARLVYNYTSLVEA